MKVHFPLCNISKRKKQQALSCLYFYIHDPDFSTSTWMFWVKYYASGSLIAVVSRKKKHTHSDSDLFQWIHFSHLKRGALILQHSWLSFKVKKGLSLLKVIVIIILRGQILRMTTGIFKYSFSGSPGEEHSDDVCVTGQSLLETVLVSAATTRRFTTASLLCDCVFICSTM